MPSQSKKQHNFMEAVAHNPAFAKKAGVPQSVGKDFSTADKGKKFGVGGNVNYSYGGKNQINKQQTRGGSIFGSQKEIPDTSLLKHIGKKEGGAVGNDKAQEERHARTLRQLAKEEQSEADKMARGGAVMKKPNPFVGGETPGKEKAEKKLPPWMYKKGEKSEGEMACGGKVKKMAKGGKVKGKRFAEGGTTDDSEEALLPSAKEAGLRAGPRAANTFKQEGEYTPSAPKKQMLEPNRDSGETIGPQGMEPIARAKSTAKAIPKQAPDLPRAQPRGKKDTGTPGLFKYAKGGSVSASRRGDGIAQRGKTKGRMV